MKVKNLDFDKYVFIQKFLSAVHGYNQARTDDDLEGWVTLNHQHIHFNDEGIPDIGNPKVFGKESFKDVDRSHVVPGKVTKMPKPEGGVSSSSTATVVSHETARKVLDGLPEMDKVQTGAQRKSFAKKVAEKLGIDTSGIKFSLRKIGSKGACVFNWVGGRNVYTGFQLKSDDERPIPYRMKTVFHESFHLLSNGMESDYGFGDRKEWSKCEELVTECVANYLYGQYSGGGKLVPSYPDVLAGYLPSIKETDVFSGCKTIDDVGRVALESRKGGNGPVWGSFYKQLKKKPLTDDYYTQYFDHIKKNKSRFIDALCDSDPTAASNRPFIEADFDRTFGDNYVGNYSDKSCRWIYNSAMALAISEEGIK